MPGTQKRQSAGAATSPLQHAKEACALTASRFCYFCIPDMLRRPCGQMIFELQPRATLSCPVPMISSRTAHKQPSSSVKANGLLQWKLVILSRSGSAQQQQGPDNLLAFATLSIS
ncbi:hypothetical protein GE21DRAFT_4323 [Neurospora crassa]|uniref:Uncharacterized protein n=1 Tax=Neurospora crassa (strain ATCC 24698 / 74-OR23-1A / CBS 708.71 / DSM 1257 / FGSC 987) TaxID=367110 RepID=Q7RWS4_NEUCR|nr:hypothetical protein NCU00048 [Neurospora crassa OR74A]EAA26923.1 hypothetical protein NCU00048 [Neurospora crassa OR74A]KHE79575.1 hypothetical protein GE21DRAFT_4323 [Neurospora crassa]|eukprot:XP_956159.1 hypothetical protein NCU00048 [Neurospora crassa OR74A]